jgi:hypothetical protein
MLIGHCHILTSISIIQSCYVVIYYIDVDVQNIE